jgi:hypothetical protein
VGRRPSAESRRTHTPKKAREDKGNTSSVDFNENVSTSLERIKRWLRRTAGSVEETVEGGSPIATPPPGSNPAGFGDDARETSTNAQTEGAAGQPWSDNS